MTFSIGQCATLACLLEVSAPKPGNVNRGADFEDLSFFDFIASAAAIAPAMDAAAKQPVGKTAFDAIAATRQVTSSNTNLGTVLLLAPLAAVPRHESLPSGVAAVLGRLTADDARHVYEAIRLARPGGMGRVQEADIHDAPPADLLAAMKLAAIRDLVARQYVNGFDDVLNKSAPWIVEAVAAGLPLGRAIVHAQLRLLSETPDSLIARKCGDEVARQASDHAAAVLAAGSPRDEAFWQAAGDFDFWLRCDHHRRNPGTTADLIAAGLFVNLREGRLAGPFRF